MTSADQDVAMRDDPKELAAENVRLRLLVGELLLKNQRLREATMEGNTDNKPRQVSA